MSGLRRSILSLQTLIEVIQRTIRLKLLVGRNDSTRVDLLYQILSLGQEHRGLLACCRALLAISLHVPVGRKHVDEGGELGIVADGLGRSAVGQLVLVASISAIGIEGQEILIVVEDAGIGERVREMGGAVAGDIGRVLATLSVAASFVFSSVVFAEAETCFVARRVTVSIQREAINKIWEVKAQIEGRVHLPWSHGLAQEFEQLIALLQLLHQSGDLLIGLLKRMSVTS